MADGMNVKLRLVPMPFPGLLSALQGGTVDMVLSGMTMTPERNTHVAFVGPYFLSGKSFLTTTATLTNKGSDDLNNPSMRVAALRGLTSETFVQQTIPKATLVPTKDYDEAINMLLQGKVDTMIADLPACVVTVARYADKGLFALATPLNREPIGIALPGDPPLVNWAQNWLREQEASGNLALLKDRWFKSASWLSQLPRGSGRRHVLPSLRLQHLPDGLEEALHADRLRLVAIEAGGHDLAAVLRHRGRCDGDDGDRTRGGIGAEPLQGFHAVHAGKLDVHEDQGGPLFRRHAQAILRVLRLDDAVAARLEHVADEHPVVVVVLDEEDQLTRHGDSWGA